MKTFIIGLSILLSGMGKFESAFAAFEWQELTSELSARSDAAAYSADGSMFAYGGLSTFTTTGVQVGIPDAIPGRFEIKHQIKNVGTQADVIQNLEFSADGSKILVEYAHSGAKVAVYDLATNRELVRVSRAGFSGQTSFFGNDGESLVVVQAGKVEIYDFSSGTWRAFSIGNPAEEILTAKPTANGRELFVHIRNKGISHWNLERGQKTREWATTAMSVDVSRDGTKWLLRSFRGDVDILDATNGSNIYDESISFGKDEIVQFSPDGNYLISGGSDGSIYFLNVDDFASSSLKSEALVGAQINKIDFSRDGHRMMVFAGERGAFVFFERQN